MIKSDNTNTCGPNSLAKFMNKYLDIVALNKLSTKRAIAQS